MAVIEAGNLCRWFGKNQALKDVSFSIQEGEIVGMIGPNGAGKSTTMNILCGYLAPTSGSVSVCGIDMMQHSADARRHIGYLPETPPLYPDMTVEEQIRFACRLSGLKKGKELEERVGELCERTHTGDMRKRLIRSLSKGYRQRTAMAQLLAGDPDILILDEPTVGLDPRQIREFRDLFLELGKTHTIVFSSHILSEINSICDRILVFEKGRLLADGKPEDLRNQLQDTVTLRVRIRAAAGDLTDMIRDLPSAADLRILPCPGETISEYLIAAASEESLSEELNVLVRRSGADILMMHTEKMSLEDIYLQITEQRGLHEDDL